MRQPRSRRIHVGVPQKNVRACGRFTCSQQANSLLSLTESQSFSNRDQLLECVQSAQTHQQKVVRLRGLDAPYLATWLRMDTRSYPRRALVTSERLMAALIGVVI